MAAGDKVLLAVDGDSLAHRAYHALPKSIKWNAILGFTNFLLRLWDAEQPAAVLVAWDSLDHPTYRHEALPAYQSGRVFEDSIVDQLDRLPDFIALRADSSDRIPGERGVGPKSAAAILRQYGSLGAGLRAGRFSAEAEHLLLYRRIALMDAKAPLPRLAAQSPNWSRAAEAAK